MARQTPISFVSCSVEIIGATLAICLSVSPPAEGGEAPPIFDVLEEVAPEIPVRLDTPEQKELLFERVQTTCASREVWIALDRDKQIVGFLMAEPDKKERSFRDNQALELVAKDEG